MKSFLLWISAVFNVVLIASADLGTDWKWHVQLVHIQQAPAQTFQCSGTLLNKLFVATAAHCLYNLNGDRLNKSQLIILLVDGQHRSIIRTFQPDPFDVEWLNNDFVLLLLDREVNFNELVAPISIPDPRMVLPQDVHTPVLNGSTFSTNDEATCLTNAKTLFGMMYADAVCLGQFEKTHKYHRSAGSGLYVEHNSSWHLVGIAMYATGPSEAHITYIGGVLLERHLTWTRRVLAHYSESIPLSEINCRSYVSNGNLPFEWVYPMVKLVDSEENSLRTMCHGTVISPRYVLTTSRCALTAKKIFIQYDDRRSFGWFSVKNVSTSGRLALIALDRDVNANSGIIGCLYSRVTPKPFAYVTRIAHTDWYVGLERIHVQYRIDEPLKVQYYCRNYLSEGRFTSPGDPLVVQEDGEEFFRVVGVLDAELDCQPLEYSSQQPKTAEAINVEQYLPWIEDVVWRSNKSGE
nr:uncharacterized protein LOC109403623 [Aedes albopictus]